MADIISSVREFLTEYAGANDFFDRVCQLGDIYLMGGLLRSYRDSLGGAGRISKIRDMDIAIDIKDQAGWDSLVENYAYTVNRFGGYKFFFGKLQVDIWDVKNTWAFREGKVEVIDGDYLTALAKSVYLNLDSIVYDVKRDKWCDMGYTEALESGVLDIVLAENPYIELNIMRAMLARDKYGLHYSDSLKAVILKVAEAKEFLPNMLAIQIRRYGAPIYLDDWMKNEVELCR